MPKKSEKSIRKVGSLSPTTPARITYTTPMAGQMGYQQRTDRNKRVVKINEGLSDGTSFSNYGKIKTQYIMVAGSIPGPKKRLIRMRLSTRPPANSQDLPQFNEVIV